MTSRLSCCLIAAALTLASPLGAFAQSGDAPGGADQPTSDPDAPQGPEGPRQTADGDAEEASPDSPEEPAEPAEPEESAPPAEESPISDIASEDEDVAFVPLESFEDTALEQIVPASLFPYVELDGMMRVRARARMGFDLDTRGTSAVTPPLEAWSPQGQPADAEANALWDANLRLRIAPTVHITESTRAHVEADILPNAVLGTGSQAHALLSGGLDPFWRLTGALRPQATSPIAINEAWGELDTFFGTLRAGRMDWHWGLGAYFNDGDGIDAHGSESIDRIQFQTNAFDFYATASWDFPYSGPTSGPGQVALGQPFDLGQADDAHQYTFSLLRAPLTQHERELQARRLSVERRPVLNGGLQFSWRTQDGQASRGLDGDPNALELLYRGLWATTTDLWVELTYEPAPNRYMRAEIEAIGVLGHVDNASDGPTGRIPSAVEGESARQTNCFDADVREANQAACQTAYASDGQGQRVDKDIRQFGLALETEFYLGGPVRFGLNGGFANGGSAPNWGYGAPAAQALDFMRLNPDYHVDLILFREVIGTVTNAVYVNPYLNARFLESGPSWIELGFDAIASRAWDAAATPEGTSPWLGLELDTSVAFVQRETLRAAVDAGVLFPLSGLDAVLGRPRLTEYGTETGNFSQARSASPAWTVQGTLAWTF